MSGFLLPAIVTICVFLVILFVLSRTTGERNIRSRLESIAPEFSGSQYADAEYNPDVDFLSSDQNKNGLAVLGESLAAITGRDVKELEREMELKFTQAGIDSPNAFGYYYLFRFICVPLSLIAAYYLFNQQAESITKLLYVFLGIGAVIVGFFGPQLYISNTKQKRQLVLQRSFPDTLDLILVCVESGLALDAALARVCRELGYAHPEITKELNRTRMELTLLSDRSGALHNLAERTDLVAFRSLVAALLQTERFGTSLTETLRVLSDDYRHTRLMIAEQKAGRLPAMLTIPLILLLMPALFIVIMGPAIISVMDAFK